jgi:hypothetical protein
MFLLQVKKYLWSIKCRCLVGTGIVANATGIEMSTNLGTTTQTTDQILSVTGLNIQSSAALATIVADGSVTTSAPADIMDTALGSVTIDIFTQVDPTAVTSTFDLGTLVAPAAAFQQENKYLLILEMLLFQLLLLVFQCSLMMEQLLQQQVQQCCQQGLKC